MAVVGIDLGNLASKYVKACIFGPWTFSDACILGSVWRDEGESM
jgi:hypothetical protein